MFPLQMNNFINSSPKSMAKKRRVGFQLTSALGSDFRPWLMTEGEGDKACP
jgi:hypothetical protein